MSRTPRIITCAECGNERPHHGKGLCVPCHQRQRRAANAERVREYARQWRAANLEQERERDRQRRAANHDFQRQYRAANPERKRERDQRRKARKRALPATLTLTEWRAILAAFGHKCAYCGQTKKKLTQDHVQPLSKGGGYTVQNIVPACGPCNSRKHVGPPPKPVQTLLL